MPSLDGPCIIRIFYTVAIILHKWKSNPPRLETVRAWRSGGNSGNAAYMTPAGRKDPANSLNTLPRADRASSAIRSDEPISDLLRASDFPTPITVRIRAEDPIRA